MKCAVGILLAIVAGCNVAREPDATNVYHPTQTLPQYADKFEDKVLPPMWSDEAKKVVDQMQTEGWWVIDSWPAGDKVYRGEDPIRHKIIIKMRRNAQ